MFEELHILDPVRGMPVLIHKLRNRPYVPVGAVLVVDEGRPLGGTVVADNEAVFVGEVGKACRPGGPDDGAASVCLGGEEDCEEPFGLFLEIVDAGEGGIASGK